MDFVVIATRGAVGPARYAGGAMLAA